ncbi:BspC domain-containing protein [Cupriavidus numazuensis]
MIRRISRLIGSHLSMLAAAVTGALVLAGCANTPADGTDAASQSATPAAPARPAPAAPATPASEPTKTITLPDRGRVSLAEYRAKMRDQLMKSEGATSDVADCAAHASWVLPRSATYDALKIPTGALGAGQATVEPWSGRFSQGKQSVPVSSVVTFSAMAHKRRGEEQWQPVKVRCGYDDGMMLAYELLDSSGATIAEPAAAPAVATSSHASSSKSSKKGAKGSKSKSTSTASAKSSTSGKSSAKASSSSSSKSSGKSTSKKKQ